jgi:hypothetical protein
MVRPVLGSRQQGLSRYVPLLAAGGLPQMRTHMDIKHETPLSTFEQVFHLDTDDCILWPHGTTQGHSKAKPYGIVRLVPGPWQRVHVLVCERSHGPRPSSQHQAAHSCGQSLCFNPRHLRWATRKENEADKLVHGTSNRGPRNGMSKLTADDVRDIRRRHAAGELQRDLAVQFGTNQANISQIVNRISWSWL